MHALCPPRVPVSGPVPNEPGPACMPIALLVGQAAFVGRPFSFVPTAEMYEGSGASSLWLFPDAVEVKRPRRMS